MSKHLPPRRGYAMIMVLLFLVIFLVFLGVVYRRVGGLLRTETIHAIQVQRDQGSIEAMGRATTLLQSGLPPTDPYVCGVTLATPIGPEAYTVTYAKQKNGTWSVHVAPTTLTEYPSPMPDSFLPHTP